MGLISNFGRPPGGPGDGASAALAWFPHPRVQEVQELREVRLSDAICTFRTFCTGGEKLRIDLPPVFWTTLRLSGGLA